MRLQNSLYHITHVAGGTGTPAYTIKLDGSHAIYQAHFPGEPITPGVCIIQIAKELLEHHLSTPLDIVAVKNAKFLSVISPIQSPRIRYVLDKITVAEDSKECKMQVQVKDTAADTQFAKISLICKRSE